MEEDEEADEEACMAFTASPSASPSRDGVAATAMITSKENGASSATPGKDKETSFAFTKPALPSKPPKPVKLESVSKGSSGEKKTQKGFVMPSASGAAKPKKNGFSVPKKAH
jgi:hypothetical protein